MYYKDSIKKPIFIVGVPRSGTTLLYTLLAQHTALGWFSKDTTLSLYTPEYLRFVYLRRRIFDMRNFSYPLMGFNNKMFTTKSPPVELGFLYDEAFTGQWKCKISPENLDFLKETIVDTLNKMNRKRFLSKTPLNSMRIKALYQVFPDCKFLHIYRDPRAVVNSLLVRSVENPSGYIGIPLKNKINFTMSALRKHALQWKQVIEEIIQTAKDIPENQFKQIKYEELIDSPGNHLEEITKFCELEPFEYVFEKNGKVSNEECRGEILNRSLKVPQIENRNKQYKNEKEIMEVVSPLNEMLEYS